MNNKLLYFLLAIVCFYLVLDEVYGGKAISKFTIAIIPSAKED